MYRRLVGRIASFVLALLLCTVGARVAFTQSPFANASTPDLLSAGLPELEGSWSLIGSEDVSNDTVPVDYVGLPLNDEGRARALSYSESQLGMVERQCEGWAPTYLLTGPFGMKITAQSDPATGTLIKYTIGAWHDKLPMEIWMDGRPHPSKYAEYTRAGFTTGSWDGNTLVTRTTHMKASFIRKNGPPSSDLATMTNRFYRHGNLLVIAGIVEDPVYLSEPIIWTRNYQVSSLRMMSVGPPCIVTFEGTAPDRDVPHFLWGKKPESFMNEMTKKYGVPLEAALGYPETLYPEYRAKMKTPQKR